VKSKLLLLLAVLGHCLSVSHAQDLSSRLDEPLNRADRKWFMGSILVARDGKILFEKNYGEANREQKIAITTSTRYRIGSLTKQFTAAAVLMLEDRGKLRTDDTVRHYLPDAPVGWDRITVYNLLTHTSGIPDYVNSPDFDAIKGKQMTPSEIIRRFRDKPLDFAPGAKEDYSNSNYAVLGRIIEIVSEQSYAEFLRINIFQRLGMKDSGVDTGEEHLPNEASGYAMDGAKIVPADFVNMSTTFGAGAVYSTAEDMLRWEQGLFGGHLLSAVALRKMTSPFRNGYACGVHVGDFHGLNAIYHSGGIDGFSSYVAYFPDDKLTVIALSNVWNRQMANIVGDLTAASGSISTGNTPSGRKQR
jgi:CubicO group peptidase (beta-lactamase class C family)